MARGIPPSSDYSGLSRQVLRYSEAFRTLIAKIRICAPTDADWAPLEALVDTAAFERHGVFLTAQAERFGWQTYRRYLTEFGDHTEWSGTLRHITEKESRVILELEERNTRSGITDVSNTVTIYEFGEEARLRRLDVYVMPLGQTKETYDR